MMKRKFIVKAVLCFLPMVSLMAQGAPSEAPPPPMQEDVSGMAPGDDYVWQAGYWSWNNNAWAWIPGAWVVAPYAGAIWIGGSWGWHNGAWAWSGGRWDRDNWNGHGYPHNGNNQEWHGDHEGNWNHGGHENRGGHEGGRGGVGHGGGHGGGHR